MWKLTVERRHIHEGYGREYETTDKMYFEARHLDEFEDIVNAFKLHATEGEFKYIIESIEEKAGEE